MGTKLRTRAKGLVQAVRAPIAVGRLCCLLTCGGWAAINDACISHSLHVLYHCVNRLVLGGGEKVSPVPSLRGCKCGWKEQTASSGPLVLFGPGPMSRGMATLVSTKGVSPEIGYSSDPVRDRPSQEQASHVDTCPHICSIPAYPRAELKVGSFCGSGKDPGRNFQCGEAW